MTQSSTDTSEPASNILILGAGTGSLIGSRPTPVAAKPTELQEGIHEFGFKFDSDGREFTSGALRDSATGKPRPDLLSPFATQRRARVMELGAAKYGIRNWEQGMPLSVFLASASRHLNQFMLGETDEDHLAHCAFNLDALMHGQEMLKRGTWPTEYNDLPNYTSTSTGNPKANQK